VATRVEAEFEADEKTPAGTRSQVMALGDMQLSERDSIAVETFLEKCAGLSEEDALERSDDLTVAFVTVVER